VDQCNSLLASHGDLANLGQAFIDVETQYGINAFWGMAQALQEVGWNGRSWIADNKHNLFGLDAYDAAPATDASVFPDFVTCVADWGKFLKTNYLTVGGPYYVSTTPAGIARHYASDPLYASKVVSIMNTLYTSSQALGHAPTPPQPVPTPQGNQYVVKHGQNMSVIAGIVGLQLSRLETLNPQAGHPAGNYNDIWPGDVLYVGADAPPAAPSPNSPVYVTVQAGQSLSVIAEDNNESLQAIEQLNPHAGHPAGNFDIIWPGDKIRIK
jgi:LysM repeat protein